MADCDKSDKSAWRIVVLALPGTPMTSIAAAIEVFRNASELCSRISGELCKNPFDVILASPDGRNIESMGGITVEVDTDISGIKYADLVIVTALLPGRESQQVLPDVRDWLLRMHSKGSMLAGFCTGAFVLASTGLLDGKRATTHWASARRLSGMYPRVQVEPHRLICDAGTVFTSGGSHGAVALCLYLVEKMCGRSTAVEYAKVLVRDMSFAGQSAYAVFRGVQDHGDREILKAQEFLEAQYSEKISVKVLSDNANMSRRTFERRFKTATGKAPGEYLQKLRIEAAKRILEMEPDTFEQITLRVGYEDATTFSKLFSKRVGVSPSVYRKKFRLN